MWPIFHNLHVIHINKDFENMNFMICCGGINYSKNIIMFHRECKYHTNITFKFYNFIQVTFYHQCEQLCNTSIYLNQYV